MDHSNFVELVATKAGLDQASVRLTLDVAAEVLGEALEKRDSVKIRGVGRFFSMKRVQGRTSRRIVVMQTARSLLARIA